MGGAHPAHRQPHASDPAGIDLRTREEIVHGAHVVPEHRPGPGEAGGIDRAPDELLRLAGAPVERRDALGRDAPRALAPVRRVVGEQHAPLAPVEHVDDDHDVAGARQLGRDALAAVVLALEVGEHGMLVVDRHQLLLAPEVEAAVVVEGDDGRRRPWCLLGYEHEGRHADVGGRVEVHLLLHVVAAIDAFDRFRAGIAGRRRVMEEVEQLPARLTLPRCEVGELLLQEGERELPRDRLAPHERVEGADVGGRDRDVGRAGHDRVVARAEGGESAAGRVVQELASSAHVSASAPDYFPGRLACPRAVVRMR